MQFVKNENMDKALKKSVLLHVLVFLFLIMDLPLFWSNRRSVEQVPIIVDLKDVKISQMTNLPPKAKFGKEEVAASKVKRKIEKKHVEKPKEVEKVVKPKPKPQVKAEEKIKSETPKKDFLVAPQPQKPKKVKKKVAPVKVEKTKKPAPKVKPKKENKQKPELSSQLQSLLASVDALDEVEGNKTATATIKEGTTVNNMGVEGGTEGSYFSELSISEIDAIAGRLRACWNLDPGAMGIEDMIIEIRVFLNQDGSVRETKILDMARYDSDRAFKAVADSARRAVYVCGPYKIFANRYADKYNLWKTMLLRFNPFDASIK